MNVDKALKYFNKYGFADNLPVKKLMKKLLGDKAGKSHDLTNFLKRLDNPERKFFVYGSLMPHEPNHHILEHIYGQWFTAYTYGKKVKVHYEDGTYEALVYDDSKEKVFGYVLDSERLVDYWEVLDQFEGDQYKRGLVKVWINEEVKVVTTYLWAGEVGDPIG